MQGVDIKWLCHVFHLALMSDGVLLSETEIEQCIRDSLSVESGTKHAATLITAPEMYLSFVDISDEIGRALGHTINKEGMALDWADPYPSFRAICMELQKGVARIMSCLTFNSGSDELIVNAFRSTVAEDLPPEVLAAVLEIEQSDPIIH